MTIWKDLPIRANRKDIDTIIIRYEDNSSVRYDEKEYVKSLSKVRREKSATGALQISECHGEDKVMHLEGRSC